MFFALWNCALIKVQWTYYIMLVSGVVNICIPCDTITMIRTSVTAQSYYNIIEYIPCTVHCIPVTYLFYN